MTPAAPDFTVAVAPSSIEVAISHLKLGVEHILLGIDHLLFVLALLILVQGTHKLIVTITAFTVAHSITLAGALREVGLPQNDIPLALLFFNVGAEVGQLIFIAAMLAVIAIARRIPVALPAWARRVPPYSIGAMASFWLIELLAALAA